METVNETILNSTCRFCQQYDGQSPGCKVCDCDAQCGYGHYRCFYQFVQQTGRRKCEYCQREWLVDKNNWKRFVVQVRRVAIMNRVREAASILLTILVFLSMAFLWAYLVKVFCWVTTGRPDYLPFGQPMLVSSGWLQPTLGDALVGVIATLVNILVAALIIHFKPRCYHSSCIQKERKGYKMSSYPTNPNDEFIPVEQDEINMDDLVSRSISRQRSKALTSIGDSVQLRHADDSSDDSGASHEPNVAVEIRT